MAGNQGRERIIQLRKLEEKNPDSPCVEERVGFEPTELAVTRLYGFQDRSIHPLWQRSKCGYSEEVGNTVSTYVYHRVGGKITTL